jgi:hypothetical protein
MTRALWHHKIRRHGRAAVALHVPGIITRLRVLFDVGIDVGLVEVRVIPTKDVLDEHVQVCKSIIQGYFDRSVNPMEMSELKPELDVRGCRDWEGSVHIFPLGRLASLRGIELMITTSTRGGGMMIIHHVEE